MDWTGLLDFSSKLSEGCTTEKTEKKELRKITKEDIEFFEGAMGEFCHGEWKKIIKDLDQLKAVPEDPNNEEDLVFREEICERLLHFCENHVENPKNLIRRGRFQELIELFFNTKYDSIRYEIANILGAVTQNEGYTQKAAIKFGLFKIIDLIQVEEKEEIISKYIYVLAGLLYGDCKESKMIFLNEYKGIQYLKMLLEKKITEKVFRRILSILQELTKFEERETELFEVNQKALKDILDNELHIILLKYFDDLQIDENSHFMLVNLLNTLDNINILFEDKRILIKSCENRMEKIKNNNEIDETTKRQEIDSLKEFILKLSLFII